MTESNDLTKRVGDFSMLLYRDTCDEIKGVTERIQIVDTVNKCNLRKRIATANILEAFVITMHKEGWLFTIYHLPTGFLSLSKEDRLPELFPQTPVSSYYWPVRLA